MFINPKVAIENGWIKGIKDPAKQCQPDAIDFTLDKVMLLDHWHRAVISESTKDMRTLIDMPHRFGEEGGWYLEQGNVYDGTSDVYVEVPEGVAAILYTRSTFARCGVLIASGLYDSGFKGHVGFTIYPLGGDITIGHGTRIGQIAFVKSDGDNVYAGGYNHQQGSHYAQERAGIQQGQSSLHVQPPAKPTLMEAPIGAKPTEKSDLAKKLEETNQWNSDQGGKPAGTQNFV